MSYGSVPAGSVPEVSQMIAAAGIRRLNAEEKQAVENARDAVPDDQKSAVPNPDDLAILEAPTSIHSASMAQGGIVILSLQVALPPDLIEGMNEGRMRLLAGRPEAFEPLIRSLADAPVLRLTVHENSLTEKSKSKLPNAV
jgi:hypothetical protein